MIKLTTEQWETYSKKYKNLMWSIAHRISGDNMLASIEDNYSDLCIAALESINGFHKKTGKTVDEMLQMKLFDQYTKTCLWTAKARKGVKLTERMPFRNAHISNHSDDGGTKPKIDIPDTRSSSNRFIRVDARDKYDSFSKELKRLVNVISDNPEVMTASGDLKVDPIAKLMGVSAAKVNKLIKSMGDRDGN